MRISIKNTSAHQFNVKPNFVYSSHERYNIFLGWKASIPQRKINIFGLKLHILWTCIIMEKQIK